MNAPPASQDQTIIPVAPRHALRERTPFHGDPDPAAECCRLQDEVSRLRRKVDVLEAERSARCRELTDALPEGVFESDLSGRLSYANSRALEMFGYSAEDLAQGKTIQEMLAESEHAVSAARIQQVLQGGVVPAREYLGRHQDGREFPVLVHARRLVHDGETVGLQGILVDLTERKALQRSESALQASQAALESLFRAVPVGLTILQGRTMRSVNDRFCEIAGRELSELVGQRSRQLYSTEEEFERVGHGLYDQLWTQGSSYVEATFRRPDGSFRHVSLFAAPLQRDNREAGVAVAIQDITERKQAEDRLRQQAALLDATHDAILVLGADGTVRFMNRAAEALTGWSFAQAANQKYGRVLRTRSGLELRAALSEVRQRGVWVGELSLRTEDGPERVVESRWALVPDGQDASNLILVTCNDITERKALEKQYLRAQRLESVGTLASGVAHDLNNILSPILMGLSMLKDVVQDPEDQSILAMMEDSTRRGTDTVKQLLTFARGAETQKGPVQPRHLLKEITRLLQQTLPKSIRITTDYSGDPVPVLADPSQLHQVLMNLCVNARDAMPEGGVMLITLENTMLDDSGPGLHPKARPGPYVVFRIADNGTGIPPEVFDRIFDPFFTTKPQGKGTGLGLATVLGIVEGHGGFVLVDSELGRGTTFSVFLPAVAGAAGATEFAPRAQAPTGRGEWILVVDDEPAVRHLAESILKRNGYTPLVAEDSATAWLLFAEHRDRLRAVLTDIMMPLGDGRHLVSLLRESAPQIPILAMSGLSTREAQSEILRLGAVAFLSKPFSGDQLTSALQQALTTAGPSGAR